MLAHISPDETSFFFNVFLHVYLTVKSEISFLFFIENKKINQLFFAKILSSESFHLQGMLNRK